MSEFVITKDTLRPNLREFPDVLDNRIRQVFAYMAPRVLAHAKQNAPWTDQTGNARQGLKTNTRHFKKVHVMQLAHSMHYGKWLEIRWSGKYATIMPTIHKMGPEVFSMVARAVLASGGSR